MSAISNTINSIWNTAQMALFVTCKNGFKEEELEEKLNEFVRSNLRDYRQNIANNLTQLDNLMLLGSEGLDAKMISALFELRKSIQVYILNDTTIGRAAYPWSSSISMIDTFAKKHMPYISQSLILLPDIEQFLPDEIRKDLKDKE